MPQIVGKGSRVALGFVAPIILEVEEWSVEASCEIIRTKASEFLGKTGANAGFVDAKMTIKTYFSREAAKNPYLNFGLVEGQKVTDLIFYIVQGLLATDGLYFYFPSALVLDAPTNQKTTEKAMFECTLVPAGPYYYPGDTIP